MKLHDILLEDLGDLKKIVGPKFANIVNWKEILPKSQFGLNPEVEKIKLEDPEHLWTHLNSHRTESAGFVVSSNDKPILFASFNNYHDFLMREANVYYDLTGLVDDEEFRDIIKLFHHKELGPKCGVIFIDGRNIAQFLGYADRHLSDFELIILKKDPELNKKKDSRFAIKYKSEWKRVADKLPLEARKKELEAKHWDSVAKKTKVDGMSLYKAAFSNENEAALDLNYDERNQLARMISKDNMYSSDDIMTLLGDKLGVRIYAIKKVLTSLKMKGSPPPNPGNLHDKAVQIIETTGKELLAACKAEVGYFDLDAVRHQINPEYRYSLREIVTLLTNCHFRKDKIERVLKKLKLK